MIKILKSMISIFAAMVALGISNADAIETSNLFQTGSNQHYNVIFDGEGEAAVVAKLTFQNLQDEELKEIVLDIPGNSVRLINLVQEIDDPTCGQNESPADQNLPSEKTTTGSIVPPRCEPRYSTIKPEKKSLADALRLTLPLAVPLVSQKSTALLLYFKATGYVSQKYSVFNFAFPTIKTDFDVDNVRVVVNVSDNLYLKEGRGQTAYLPNVSTLERATDFSAISSPPLKELSSSIESNQGFVKMTYGLDPGENFIVSGKYYKSSIFSSLGSIVAVGVVIVILFVLIIYIIKKEKEG